jgi:hypothetical protein
VAASSNQKIDYLLKKIGYTASKTGIAEDGSISGTKKSPSGEAIASPLVVPSASVWADSDLIPTTPPGTDSDTVKVYLASASGHRMTVDSTVSGSRSFIAYATYNDTSSGILGDWIDTQFSSDYIIKVYKGDPNSGGVQLSAAGSGSSDGWFFDYSSGVLNFNDTNVPTGVSDTNIYVVGYRYIGKKGVVTPGGISSITQLNVSGIATIPQLQAGTVNASGIITATQFHTGASGSAIRVTNGTISGPATLTIDPAAVGDNTGTVVIAGGLQVDGTTTTVNSTTVNIVDKNVQLATGAADDSAANGAGITVDSGDGDKTINFEATGDNWGFSENINLATGKVLKINNTDILSATTLGSSVVSSSLTSLGTIGSLVATTADINAGTIDNSVIGGSTPAAGTFSSLVATTADINAGTVDNVVIGGSTAAAGSFTTVAASSNVTVTGAIDVDGHTNLDNVSISGVATVTGALTASGGFVANSAKVSDLTSGRVVVAGTSGELEDASTFTFSGGTVTATSFSGNLTGNVTGASSLVGVTAVTDNATHYLTFVDSSSGNEAVKVDTGLTYNPNTNQLVLAGLTWPTADGAADQVLSTDGAGTLTFQTVASSSGAGTSISQSSSTATAGQTAFTAPNVFDDGAQSKPFVVEVFNNGVRQRVGAAASNDFQLSAPQTVNFNAGSAASAGDRVTIQVGYGYTITEQYFTATQDQTSFQTSTSTPGAIKEKIHVYLNGILLRRGTDYTAGSPITLVEAADVGDEVSLISDAGEDVFTATAGQTIFTPTDNDTTADNIQVYQNGVRLELTQDYTKGSPQVTIINPASGLDAGDELDVVITR